ncbi:HNH endonuclease signature motif containing protein [Streptomyces sp. ODS28]|uniref:HNH endonuclease signature motif containing protein n=1 Tax=Streptomyces sp. ODS28 TaxID=3136688 RepID=UPI0031EA2CA1
MKRYEAFRKERLEGAAADSRSYVDLLRRLGVPPGSRTKAYLRRRLVHYGIDTSHFADEPLPERPRRSYPRERLAESAARCHSIREMLVHMEVPSEGWSYTHIRKQLDRYGIDTSHFTSGRRHREVLPLERLVPAVASARSLRRTLLLLSLPDTGAGRELVKRSIDEHGLSTEHFTGQAHASGQPSPHRRKAADVLVRRPRGQARTQTATLRRALDETGVPHLCAACGLGDMWQGSRLVLEIDHVNGDRLDNRLTNLRYLCPSCHSQTRTFSKRSP